ncbi:MAG: HAMP domain-containing protein, partial [Alphaproteobacteria bacterium]|nr:HAMP domain-containing protein [Alphaproteobacteria bacterium]
MQLRLINEGWDMNLSSKVTVFFIIIAASLVAVVVAINLYACQTFSIASSTEHLRTSAEIVRVHLTESMINGVIDKRESFLRRLMEVKGLTSAQVVRSPLVVEQFGKGIGDESAIDEMERQVMLDAKPQYRVIEIAGDTLFRGTIPFVASAHGTPNCMQCHHVSEGQVLGAVSLAVSIGGLKHKAILTIAGIVGIVTLFAAVTLLLVRRLIQPITAPAHSVEAAVKRVVNGDFSVLIEPQASNDELGKIASDMNRLLKFLDQGLSRIGDNVSRLTGRPSAPDENRLTATIDMVDGLVRAAHFKKAIEEDETNSEIHLRLSHTLAQEFGVYAFSLYEVVSKKNLMIPLFIDGQPDSSCRWCDPQILVRSEACRARRTGHSVDGIANPGICYAFAPPRENADWKHVCLPIILSGSVGAVLQLVAKPGDEQHLSSQVPFI